MSSLKQIEANRRNAQQSTGPRTTEGKAVSRYNALGGGIYADRETVLPHEDPEALTALAAEYYEQFQPSSPEQRCLVDCLVNGEWLLRRFRRIEAEVMTRAGADSENERFALGEAYVARSGSLERLQRRVNATHRSYLKTLETLKALQAAEEAQIAAERQALREAAARRRTEPTPQNEPLAPAIGFVPSLPSGPAPEAPEALALRL